MILIYIISYMISGLIVCSIINVVKKENIRIGDILIYLFFGWLLIIYLIIAILTIPIVRFFDYIDQHAKNKLQKFLNIVIIKNKQKFF